MPLPVKPQPLGGNREVKQVTVRSNDDVDAEMQGVSAYSVPGTTSSIVGVWEVHELDDAGEHFEVGENAITGAKA